MGTNQTCSMCALLLRQIQEEYTRGAREAKRVTRLAKLSIDYLIGRSRNWRFCESYFVKYFQLL